MLAVIGSASLWKRNKQTLGVCLLPLGVNMVAALARQYPYHGGRTTIYLLPALLLLAGTGLEWIRQRLLAATHEGTGWRSAAFWRPWWWAAAAPMVVVGMVAAVLNPMGRSHIRPAVQYLREHRRSGEAIYVVGEGRSKERAGVIGGQTEFYCYWREPEPPIHPTMPVPAEIPEERFWVVFAFQPKHQLTWMDSLLAEIRQTADESDRFIDKRGGAAILFQKKGPVKDSPASQPVRAAAPSDE